MKLEKFNLFKNFIFALCAAIGLTQDFNEIPGTYNLLPVIIAFLLMVFFKYVEKQEYEWNIWLLLPAFGTAFFMLIGESYLRYDSSIYVWGSKLRLLFFLISLVGLTFLFYYLYTFIYQGMIILEKKGNHAGKFEKILLERFGLLKVALIIFLTWVPVLLLSYPGGYCGDSGYQMRMALGQVDYDTIHPLTHTLFLEMFLKFGKNVLGSYNRGMFLQLVVQGLIMAFVLSYSIIVLYKRKVNKIYTRIVFGIYLLAPLYSNFATMTIKDTLFNTWILLYFIYMTEMLLDSPEKVTLKRSIQIVLSALGVMLFRNNGPIVVGCTVIGLGIFLALQKNNKIVNKLLMILVYGVVPLVLFVVINGSLIRMTNPISINGKEYLSLPFQQTGRYIRDYGDEITLEEWEGIGKVLNTSHDLGYIYNPNSSDPLKREFVEDSTTADVIQYLTVWAQMFVKHPGVYVEAILNHCYGWFDITLDNSIRYVGYQEFFYPPRWGDNNEYVYTWFEHLSANPITGWLENVAIYVWWMFILAIRLWKNKDKRAYVFMIPLFVSLLVCIASPGCILHPRYAFPIVFTMPFLTGALLNKSNLE